MKDSVVLPFLLGLVFGITAMLIGSRNESDPPQQETEKRETIVPVSTSLEPQVCEFPVGSHADKPDTIPVLVVASEQSSPPEKISEEMVAVIPLPIGDVPVGAVLSIKELSGKYLTPDAIVGDVITHSMLVDRPGSFLPSRPSGTACGIPTGNRVYTVVINGSADYLGLIRPHDHVDVFVTYISSDKQGNNTLKTKRILSSVKVFATGFDRYGTGTQVSGRRAISLLVDPKSVAVLMMAQAKGAITVALPPNDHESLERSRHGTIQADK